jgi:hypothetical protein
MRAKPPRTPTPLGKEVPEEGAKPIPLAFANKWSRLPMIMRKCIYCLNEFDETVGEGEHVLPDGFGRFIGQFVFRGMCLGCNRATGDCDEELIRCSPAGLACVAAARSDRLQRRRKGGRTALVASHGIKPPQIQVWIDGKPRLATVDVAKLNRLEIPNQMRVTLADGESPPILLHPAITLGGMRAKLSKWHHASVRRIDVYAEQPAFDHYMSLLLEIFPKHDAKKRVSLDVGVHDVKGEAMCMMSNRSLRAVAKIAFHYFLLTTHRGFNGHEAVFGQIRQFIRWGGAPFPHFASGQFPAVFDWYRDDGKPSLPEQLQHILALDECEQEIRVLTWLGIGPAGDTPRYIVRLGKLPNALVHVGGIRAHHYVYKADAAAGYSGDVAELSRTVIAH